MLFFYINPHRWFMFPRQHTRAMLIKILRKTLYSRRKRSLGIQGWVDNLKGPYGLLSIAASLQSTYPLFSSIQFYRVESGRAGQGGNPMSRCRLQAAGCRLECSTGVEGAASACNVEGAEDRGHVSHHDWTAQLAGPLVPPLLVSGLSSGWPQRVQIVLTAAATSGRPADQGDCCARCAPPRPAQPLQPAYRSYTTEPHLAQ